MTNYWWIGPSVVAVLVLAWLRILWLDHRDRK